MASTVLPFGISEELRRRLQDLAERDEKLATAFFESVMREALGYNDELKAAVERGLKDVEDGRTLTTDELMERVNKKLASLPDEP